MQAQLRQFPFLLRRTKNTMRIVAYPKSSPLTGDLPRREHKGPIDLEIKAMPYPYSGRMAPKRPNKYTKTNSPTTIKTLSKLLNPILASTAHAIFQKEYSLKCPEHKVRTARKA